MYLFIVILSLVGTSYAGSWEPVAPGISYQYHRYKNINNAFILRVDRSNKNVIIDTMVAGEKVKGSRERTTAMYARCDDSLTAWPNNRLEGTRSRVVGAVNGYYFGMGRGTWISGGIANGWYVHRFNTVLKHARASGYSIKPDGKDFIGECVKHPGNKNYLHDVKRNAKLEITGLNEAKEGDLVIFTHHYDVTTPESNGGMDIVIEFSRPAGITNGKNKLEGKVIAVHKSGKTPIPFDAIVAHAKGVKATKLAGVKVGDTIGIYQDMSMFTESGCKKEVKNLPWDNTFSALALDSHHLRNGKRIIYSDKTRHPRTSMAYNSKYMFFYVVDGRTSKSKGMTIDELSEFAQKYLNATDGGALDGGGSSTLVVKKKIMNHPSDGHERTVTNGVLFAIPEPKSISSKHKENQKVKVTKATHLYAGPGSNYHAFAPLSAGASGTIMKHALMGIKAKGDYWWKIDLGKSSGWVPEAKIA